MEKNIFKNIFYVYIKLNSFTGAIQWQGGLRAQQIPQLMDLMVVCLFRFKVKILSFSEVLSDSLEWIDK